MVNIDALNAYLSADEKLTWSGGSQKSFVFTGGHVVFLLVGGIFFMVPTIFGSFMQDGFHDPVHDSVPFFLYIFRVTGAIVLWAVFIRIPQVQRKTVYGLTNRRVLFLIGGKKFYSLDVHSTSFTFQERNDKTGTIIFGENIRNQIDYPYQFLRIGDVRKVYELLINIKNNMTTITNSGSGDLIYLSGFTGNFVNKSTLTDSLKNIDKIGGNEEAKKELVSIAKEIEQTKDVAAGVMLDKFNEEAKKPQLQQDKSLLKKYWDGLVKVMPQALTIGKTISSIIALF